MESPPTRTKPPAKLLTQDAALHLISKPLVTVFGKIVGLLKRYRDIQGLKAHKPLTKTKFSTLQFVTHPPEKLEGRPKNLESPKRGLLEQRVRRTGEAEVVHEVGKKELLRRDPSGLGLRGVQEPDRLQRIWLKRFNFEVVEGFPRFPPS